MFCHIQNTQRRQGANTRACALLQTRTLSVHNFVQLEVAPYRGTSKESHKGNVTTALGTSQHFHAIPGEVNPVFGFIHLRSVYNLSKLVTPHDLVHQIRLTGHEGIAKLCSPFECHHNLCIDLREQREVRHMSMQMPACVHANGTKEAKEHLLNLTRVGWTLHMRQGCHVQPTGRVLQWQCTYRFEGYVSVAAEWAALIDGVLLNQRQQQLTINIPNIQALNPDRDMLSLCCVTPLTPSVQVCFHLGLNYLYTMPMLQ